MGDNTARPPRVFYANSADSIENKIVVLLGIDVLPVESRPEGEISLLSIEVQRFKVKPSNVPTTPQRSSIEVARPRATASHSLLFVLRHPPLGKDFLDA